jgi:hypothetical protein
MSGRGLRWWLWGSFCAGIVVTLLLGWLTPFRGLLHSGLVMLGGGWLVPLLIGLGLCVLLPTAAMAIILASDNFSGNWRSGSRSMLRAMVESPWRHKLDHAREPWRLGEEPRLHWWGFEAGTALGIAGWLVWLAAVVLPPEVDTLNALLSAEARLDARAASTRDRLASANGLLLVSDVAASEAPALDAFGHAIRYERSAFSTGPAYTLRSLGADGVRSQDDLCVQGHTQNLPVGGQLGDATRFREGLGADRVGWSDRLAALAQTRCSPSLL